MNDVDRYKPGFKKLVHHLDHLKKIQNREVVGPIHLSVFPTNRCQLKCAYCGFRNTKRNSDELSLEDYKIAIDTLQKYGLKATENSGGGDPLLWKHFSESTEYSHKKGLNLSLVTNGLGLADIPKDVLKLYDWIRVSIQSTEYAENIAFDYIPNNVEKTMSFIVHDENDIKELDRLYSFAKKKNIIIRVAPERPCSEEWANKVLSRVWELGNPLIGFEKNGNKPVGCYMAYIRAALDWNGYFIPCPSIEITPESTGIIPDSFKLCHATQIEEWLQNNRPHDLGYQCSFCNCGHDTNGLIYTLLEEIKDVNFVQ